MDGVDLPSRHSPKPAQLENEERFLIPLPILPCHEANCRAVRLLVQLGNNRVLCALADPANPLGLLVAAASWASIVVATDNAISASRLAQPRFKTGRGAPESITCSPSLRVTKGLQDPEKNWTKTLAGRN
ncbi:hypothetical protein N7532_005208 [Penicillium argentinense]|uniref:Uncharacterized protein n=1 Tax=Penicillium argentinense TaxID=1131581 RepID=A0A9W9KAQ1_9EURO|nr:uncharacterized protein N7532_005208 [Penicillium argentinense]KAJ5098207.1 hypothetical protein N7532_005208 [Penicillium argentinense]